MGMSAKVDAGDCFYAMEFIEGESLETRLRRNGPLQPASRLRLLCRSHVLWPLPRKRGLVHRDLKPANIMLVAEEEITAANALRCSAGEAWVKVIDFGLAKLAGEEDEPGTPRRFFGTLAFSSPEQLEAGRWTAARTFIR